MINEAQNELVIRVFALKDPHLIQRLKKSPLHQTIEVDPKHPPCSLNVMKKKSRGLMHEKTLIVDKTITVLGSTNFTFDALHLHDNMLLVIHNKDLARACERRFHTRLFLNDQLIELYHLPDQDLGEHMILRTLKEAKQSIFVAMYCLTSDPIIEELKQASLRGVDVKIVVDRHFFFPYANKFQGLKAYPSGTSQMLHYKFAVVDESICITGSANWTASGLHKNRETLLIIHHLNQAQQRVLKKTQQRILRSTNQKHLPIFGKRP